MSFFSPKDSTAAGPPTAARQARGRAARDAGYNAEDAAVRFLQDKDVHIVARNVRSKGGEIDIIGNDHGTIIFVEVRMRRNQQFGGAADSVTLSKQRRIASAAHFFLLKNPAFANRPCRFDCILLDSPDQMEWLRDAFRLD